MRDPIDPRFAELMQRYADGELHGTMDNAILREKQLKAGSRAKKIALVEEDNPDWQDLYGEIIG